MMMMMMMEKRNKKKKNNNKNKNNNSPQWTKHELHSVIPNSELHSPFCASGRKERNSVLDFFLRSLAL
jgi:hypothetical protein